MTNSFDDPADCAAQTLAFCVLRRRSMSNIISFRDLESWQKAMDLAELVYGITRGYPPEERFGLALHTRKTAVAVPSNVAEGTRRRIAGYIARVTDALAEHAELETQVILGDRLHYVKAADMNEFSRLSGSVGRLTHGLLRSLEAKAERESGSHHRLPIPPIPNP